MTCLQTLPCGQATDTLYAPVFNSEEVAILPSGGERGSSSSKRRGEVDGGGYSELEAAAGGDFAGFRQLTSSSHPFSGMVPGTRTERSALMMRNASSMNPSGKGARIASLSYRLSNGQPPRLIQSHVTNRPFENPKPEHVKQSRGQNQQWPASGQRGYITPAIRGVANASERGTKSAMAHKWAAWLHNPCCLGVPQRFVVGESLFVFWCKSCFFSKKKKGVSCVYLSKPCKSPFFWRTLHHKKSLNRIFFFKGVSCVFFLKGVGRIFYF